MQGSSHTDDAEALNAITADAHVAVWHHIGSENLNFLDMHPMVGTIGPNRHARGHNARKPPRLIMRGGCNGPEEHRDEHFVRRRGTSSGAPHGYGG